MQLRAKAFFLSAVGHPINNLTSASRRCSPVDPPEYLRVSASNRFSQGSAGLIPVLGTRKACKSLIYRPFFYLLLINFCRFFTLSAAYSDKQMTSSSFGQIYCSALQNKNTSRGSHLAFDYLFIDTLTSPDRSRKSYEFFLKNFRTHISLVAFTFKHIARLVPIVATFQGKYGMYVASYHSITFLNVAV